jgi:hypothetical protein
MAVAQPLSERPRSPVGRPWMSGASSMGPTVQRLRSPPELTQAGFCIDNAAVARLNNQMRHSRLPCQSAAVTAKLSHIVAVGPR